MTDSDEKAVEVMARAIMEANGCSGPMWRAYVPHARAALDAYLKHCSSTLESVVMGEGGDVEDGEKETRN